MQYSRDLSGEAGLISRKLGRLHTEGYVQAQMAQGGGWTILRFDHPDDLDRCVLVAYQDDRPESYIEGPVGILRSRKLSGYKPEEDQQEIPSASYQIDFNLILAAWKIFGGFHEIPSWIYRKEDLWVQWSETEEFIELKEEAPFSCHLFNAPRVINPEFEFDLEWDWSRFGIEQLVDRRDRFVRLLDKRNGEVKAWAEFVVDRFGQADGSKLCWWYYFDYKRYYPDPSFEFLRDVGDTSGLHYWLQRKYPDEFSSLHECDTGHPDTGQGAWMTNYYTYHPALSKDHVKRRLIEGCKSLGIGVDEDSLR